MSVIMGPRRFDTFDLSSQVYPVPDIYCIEWGTKLYLEELS